MKTFFWIIAGSLALALASAGCTQGPSGHNIIPRTSSSDRDDGRFILESPIRIKVDSDEARAWEVAEFLAGVLGERSGFDVTVQRGGAESGAIVLDTRYDHPNREAYELLTNESGARIGGASPEGLLWGVQTFRQLLPIEFDDPGGSVREEWSLPAVAMKDEPRFQWRGSLMDVGRHFFPVGFVKRYIDLLSRYKMNVLHWHLTEDQGWRLEIEQYPRLTEVAAWRTEADGSRSGGFYTQAEVREIIEYARVRGVTVVPEIEMPGHATAALVAYPGLACADPPEAVPIGWGVHPDIYCAGHEETFTFLENVLDEVVALFPSRYIHIGGDEVPKDRWRDCEPCQEIIRREGLADEDELQAWFIQRIGEHLASRGRTLIGWDEILDGGGVPGSVVQIWRSQDTALEAIRQGHDVIVSPTSHAYFDGSPAGLTLDRVYSFDPAPPDYTGEDRSRVLGGEANLWSEYITTANFDFQAFPRLLAMSEALWSYGERDYDDFKRRLDNDHYARLRAMGVRPGPEDSDVVRLSVGTDDKTGEPRVNVEAAVDGLVARYTRDGTSPTGASPVVTDSTTFSAGDLVVLGVFAGEDPLPLRRGFSVIDHLARGKPIKLQHPPDSRYPGPGPSALTDGLLGSTNHHDGISQGWWDSGMVATIDLGEAMTIEGLSISFLDNLGSWIAAPAEVHVEFSADGTSWTAPARLAESTRTDGEGERPAAKAQWSIRTGEESRYLRVTARQSPLPDDHPGAGHAAWVFADEIVVW